MNYQDLVKHAEETSMAANTSSQSLGECVIHHAESKSLSVDVPKGCVAVVLPFCGEYDLGSREKGDGSVDYWKTLELVKWHGRQRTHRKTCKVITDGTRQSEGKIKVMWSITNLAISAEERTLLDNERAEVARRKNGGYEKAGQAASTGDNLTLDNLRKLLGKQS